MRLQLSDRKHRSNVMWGQIAELSHNGSTEDSLYVTFNDPIRRPMSIVLVLYLVFQK